MAPVPKNYRKVGELKYEHKPTGRMLQGSKELSGMYRIELKMPNGEAVTSGTGGANKEDTRSRMMDIMKRATDRPKQNDVV